jgi:exodeoxyribonuclease VII large subunit
MRSRLAAERARVEQKRAKLSDPRFTIVQRQQELDDCNARLQNRVRRLLVQRRAELENLTRRLLSRHPRAVIAESRAQLHPMRVRLYASLKLRMHGARSEISDAAARLNGLSPLAVLGRGYAIAHGKDGRPLLSAAEADVGDTIRVRLSNGLLTARVLSTESDPKVLEEET